MYSIIGTLMEPMSFIVGACLGAVLATGICLLGIYLDHRQMVKIAKEHVYDSMDLLFSGSYWDQRLALEIVLPEV